MLADFCFADLLLYVPDRDGRWLVVAQVRPATGQTLYLTDWVGTPANAEEAACCRRATTRASSAEGEVEPRVDAGDRS